MPRKGGRMTAQEHRFVETFAATGDKTYSGHKAGYAFPNQQANNALARPAVQAEVARVQQEKLFSTILPLAVKVHEEILNDKKAPAGARMMAVKLAYDRTLGTDEAGRAKDPHEMTPDELNDAIERLKRMAADRAKPVLEMQANDEAKGSIFE
jgi:hypothetical protein